MNNNNSKRLDTFIEAYKLSNNDTIKVQSASIDGDVLTSFCTLKEEPDYMYKLDCNLTTREGGITLYKEVGFTELTVDTEDV